MSDLEEHPQQSERKPRWLDYWRGYLKPENVINFLTLAVLAATLFYVKRYAKEAHLQNLALVDEVKQQVMINRPVLIANGVSVVDTNSIGVPTKVRVAIVNFGRSATPQMTAVGHILLTNAGTPAPIDPQCDEHGAWPKAKTLTALVPYEPPTLLTLSLPKPTHSEQVTIPLNPVGVSVWDWTPAIGQDVNDVKAGKTLFVVGCAYYLGLDHQKYFSDVCVSWAGGGTFLPCNDPARNFVD